jgi:hypothetical protein
VAVGDVERIDALGIAHAGHRYRRRVPHAELVERSSLLAIRQIRRRRLFEVAEPQPRGDVRNADETVGILEGQRLQQHAAHHREDRRVRANAERERQDGDECETGRPKQPACNQLDAARKDGHRRFRRRKRPTVHLDGVIFALNGGNG